MGRAKRDFLEVKIFLSFDISCKHVFDQKTLRGIRRQTGFQLDVLESERLRLLPT